MRKLLVIALFVAGALRAQDIHFSQYFVAPQLINPSAFGVFNSYEAGMQYKGQWNSFTNGYKSFAAFANKSFKSKKKGDEKKSYVSAGLNVIYDKAGDGQLTHFKAELPVNVTKRVGAVGFFSGGLNVGFGQLALKNTNFTWGNQFNGYEYNAALNSYETMSGATKAYFDCAAGISYTTYKKEKNVVEMNSPKNTFGFSASHLNKPNYSLVNNPDERLRMRFNFYEYHHIYIKNTDMSVVPSILVQYQGGAYEVVAGTYFRKRFKSDSRYTGFKTTKYISLGFFYRIQDACAVNLMMELKNYSIAVNYDFNLSQLTPASKTKGGLEISLKVNDAFRHLYKGIGKF